jgi:hypothetical protein
MNLQLYSLCGLLALEGCVSMYSSRRVEFENEVMRCTVFYSKSIDDSAPIGARMRGDFTCLLLADRRLFVGRWYEGNKGAILRNHYLLSEIKGVNICDSREEDERCRLLLQVLNKEK